MQDLSKMSNKELLEEIIEDSDVSKNIWIVDDETGKKCTLHTYYKKVKKELKRRLALVPKWLPINHPIPEGVKNVLILVKHGSWDEPKKYTDIQVGGVYDAKPKTYVAYRCEEGEAYEITHWMFLPPTEKD